MDFKGKRFRISDDGRLLEQSTEAPPAKLLAATLVSKEEIQLHVTPENAYTEEDFQDLFHARSAIFRGV